MKSPTEPPARLCWLRLKLLLTAWVAVGVFLPHGTQAALVGYWNFEVASDLSRAVVGSDLALHGGITATSGVGGDGAATVARGAWLTVPNPIGPNGSGDPIRCNQFTILMDLKIPDFKDSSLDSGVYTALFDFRQAGTDADYFIRKQAGETELGVSAISYVGAGPTSSGDNASGTFRGGTWYRLVYAVDNGGTGRSVYLNGTKIGENNGNNTLDYTRGSLGTAFGVFQDEDAEQSRALISNLALYDRRLSDLEIADLGAAGSPIVATPGGNPPAVTVQPAGPTNLAVGVTNNFVFAATDPNHDTVQLQVDWGNGTLSAWSVFGPSGQSKTFAFAYRVPGSFTLSARARDAGGATSAWVAIQSVSVTGAAQVTFATPPYLQNASTDRIVVMCESVENLQLGVAYGTNETYGTVRPMTRQASGGGTQFQRALLDGLSAGTTYHYRLVYYPTGDPVTTDAVFRTAPAGDADFKFAVWSDSQGHNHGAWTADPLQPTTAMMQHMVTVGADFGFGTGDLAESGSSYADTRTYFLDRVARHLGTARPFFIAWGNHDTGDPSAPLRLATDLPSRFRAGFSPGHGSYVFTYANVFFVALDYYYQDEIANGWLAAQLASPAAQNARFRIVGIHVPPYCERWIDGSTTLRSNLVPLLERHRVNLCFSGHTHEYERGATNGVNYVVTGGGSWLDHPEVVVKDWPHIAVGGAQDLTGFWAKESSPGVLGTPQPIVGGLVNQYTLVTVRGNYLKLELCGFHADGSYIGVLDAFEIGTDPGLRIRVLDVTRTPAGLRLSWSSVAGFRYRIEAATVFGAWTELEVGGQPVEVLATGGETAYVVPWPTPLPDGQFFRVKLVAP
jgi:hypothetical protein